MNRLVLEGVYIEDLSGDPLLEANHLSARFEIVPILKGKFVFTTVRLFGFTMNLRKETPDDTINMQFIIDAFSSQDTIKKEMNIDLRLNSLLFRRGHITYDVKSEIRTPDKFNAKHIDIENVSANISLKAFNKDTLNAHIKRLSFIEASGFELNRLNMNIVGNRDSAYIDDFEIRLPLTKLKINKASLNYAEVDGLSSFLNNAPVELSIAPSQVALYELSPFIPAFKNFMDTIQLSADAAGTFNNINLNHLTIRQSDKMLFNGMMNLRGISTPQETYVFGRVNKMYITSEGIKDLISNFNENDIEIPEPVYRLGSVNFTGEVSGFFDNLVAFGRFTSSIGTVETDMIFGKNIDQNISAYLSGHISTTGLALAEIFDESMPIGYTRFDVTLDASKPKNGNFSGNIQADLHEFTYKDYAYSDILLSGNFKNNGFDGLIHINDPNGEIWAEGVFANQQESSIFNFTAYMKHFRPDLLNLTEKYESPEIDFKLFADFTGNSIDNLEGNIILDSLSIQTTLSDFFLNKLEIAASGKGEERKLAVVSDIINGEVVGAYSFTTIFPSMMQTVEEYVPLLVKATHKSRSFDNNNFSVLLTIENTEDLSNTLKLPATILEQAKINGLYNNQFNRFRIEATLPKFKIGNNSFESGYLICENPLDKINLLLNTINYNDKGLRNYLNLQLDAKENLISSVISWANNKEQLFKTDLKSAALFVDDIDERGNHSLRTEITIDKSELFVNDSLWVIGPAAITVKDQRIDIDNFFITHDDQFIHLDGSISHDPLDTLFMELQQIELSYIFETLNIPILQFGGIATGTFNISDLYASRMLNTDLEVQDFSFNQVNVGRLNLYSEWDDQQQGILMLGSVYKNDSVWTDVSGYIFPVKPNDGLSLHFDANDIDIAIIQPFLKDVAKDIKGSGYGQVHLYGAFSKVTIDGHVYVEDAGMGIDLLNTYYTFSDSVYLTPESIQLRNTTLFDKFGNTGRASLTFNHKYFKDYNFDANITVNNVLLYDKSERQNPMIFGTVFGSGRSTIIGNESVIDFDINLQSGPKSVINFNFMTNSASDEYNFITFIDKNNLDSTTNTEISNGIRQPSTIITDEGTEIRMNVLVDITPDATIELIMDPTAGDKIRGTSTGSLQVQYGTKSDLRMYGGVDIVEGSYNFSLQQLIHRDFKIREGSSISFQGDPYNANMNVNAIYTLTANLSDLDNDLAQTSGRTNVPVNCVLKLDGMLRSPNISFDIELPNSNEEIERLVRSYIDTDEMMTRQIVYLLVLSKFYTPDYRSNEFSAMASSALSSQLSSILNSITDKVQIGTNIRAGQDWFTEDTEFEMLLSSQLLDNRLIFNGNFGYRNNILQGNVFVGEFDLEYKLTRSGEISLKAYNHANDMYQYMKQSMTTQGVGISFKKEFTTLSDIFRRRRNILLPVEEK